MWLILVVVVLLCIIWLITSNKKCEPELESMTNSNGPLELDINTFDQYYAGRRNQLNNARLDRMKSNEYVSVLNLFLDASNKGKRTLAYKDVPNSPKMYEAFELLRSDPDLFFNALSKMSDDSKHKKKEPVNQSNVSNLGLQIENEPTKTTQYIPTKPASMWKYIERSRGPH